MEIIFKDKNLQELITTGKNKQYKRIAKDSVLMMNGLTRVYTTLLFAEIAENIKEVQNTSYLHYEKLKHKYSGISSVRIVEN